MDNNILLYGLGSVGGFSILFFILKTVFNSSNINFSKLLKKKNKKKIIKNKKKEENINNKIDNEFAIINKLKKEEQLIKDDIKEKINNYNTNIENKKSNINLKDINRQISDDWNDI